MPTRSQHIEAIRKSPSIPVLIIGGGINGIGVFRDLALQGIPAVLVEKTDFCAGTSAASTRIIHGGLRYLENGEFRLVREALNERTRLLENAPHYVRPLPITIPIRDWTSGIIHAAKTFFRIDNKPGERGAMIIKIGLTLYDLFAGKNRDVPGHKFASRNQALIKRPQLTKDIVCTATYYDAQIVYPERLGLELILDAEADSSEARALNYVSLDRAEGTNVFLRDELTGKEICVQPQIVINATGAWIDFTNRAMKHNTMYIGGTKGSHLVIDNKELFNATQGHMLYFVNRDGRICIFYAFGDKVIAGSTDIKIDSPDEAVCDDEEATYILESIRMVFPKINIQDSDVVFRFCGVRPLPNSETVTTGQISRDHSCEIIPAGNTTSFPIYSLIGGKWTTFRAFSEQVTDRVLTALNKKRIAGTEHIAIGGGKNFPRTPQEKELWCENIAKSTHISKQQALTLLERYGTRAELITSYIGDTGNNTPLKHHPGYSEGEIKYLIEHEYVTRLDDLIFRRTLMALLGELSLELLDELTNLIANANGWSDKQKHVEIQRVREMLRTRHNVIL